MEQPYPHPCEPGPELGQGSGGGRGTIVRDGMEVKQVFATACQGAGFWGARGAISIALCVYIV